MEDLARQLSYTVTLRPYFFLFFLVYLIGCALHLGLIRTCLFALGGFAIAWTAEFSSIHTGFPFGHYRYTELTKGLELWVWKVPFIDSMSFVFLAWASYTMALLVVSPLILKRFGIWVLETKVIRQSLHVRILAALFFVYLDIVIDPVALRGERWFLGNFYYYPEPGVYFGVPLANFGGWLLVGFLMVWLLQLVDRLLDKAGVHDWMRPGRPWIYLMGPVLYLGVLLFGLSVTFHIGEPLIGWVGIFLFLLPFSLVVSSISLHGKRVRKQDLMAHLRDFPSMPKSGTAGGSRKSLKEVEDASAELPGS
jgi:uncharacterized membrane protein